MTLLERRRAMMQRHGEPDWTYIVLPDSSGVLIPIAVAVSAGQKIRMEWENATEKGLNYRIWALKGGAKFAETTKTDLQVYYISNSGVANYTVTSGGVLVIGGLYSPDQYQNYRWYAMRAEVLRVRIT